MWIFAIALIVFLFAALFLILCFGYLSTEEERAREAAAAGAGEALGALGEGLLAPLAPAPAPSREDALVAHVEEHVRRERDVATAFTAEPTAEHLVSRPSSAVESVVREIEAYLEGQRRSVRAFVASPSVHALCG